MALTHGPSVITNDLLAYLDSANSKSYSGSGSTWTDLGSNKNNFTLTNGPAFTSGIGGYFTFDGTNDHATSSLSIESTPSLQPWSYEVWTRITAWPTAAPPNSFSNTTRCGILLGATYYGGAGLYWYGGATGNSCTMYAFLRGNDAYRNTSGYGMALNSWYQFVMVNDYPNAIRLYVNGVEYANTPCATQNYNAGLIAGLTIGIALAQVDGGGEANYSNYPGQISVAKVYNTALSAARVSQNFQALRGRYGI